jgi:hypothetical protein
VVHYLSPDGTQQLTVERFPSFYRKNSVDDYVRMLEKDAPNYRRVSRVDDPPAQLLTYRTSEMAAGNNRETFAKLIPAGIDLWVLAVTVPVEQEDSGRTKVFEPIAGRFKPTG